MVNVTWREKSYVGTLLDCTKHDWAPPLPCDYGDEDWQVGKVIRKRARGSLSDSDSHAFGKLRNGKGRKMNSGFTVPSSPKHDVKRKAIDGQKRLSAQSPVLIECPEPNCDKKYKHINGLKYHQTHAHGELRAKREEQQKAESLAAQDQDAVSATSNGSSAQSPPPATPNKLISKQTSDDSSEYKDGALSGYSDISDDDDEDSSSEPSAPSRVELLLPPKSDRTKAVSINNGPQLCPPVSSPASDSVESFVFKSSSFTSSDSNSNFKSSSLQYSKDKRSDSNSDYCQYSSSGRVKIKCDRKESNVNSVSATSSKQ